MAITGKFLADFQSFYDACSKAEVSLRSFETNANKVGTSLNKMADSFSGRKVIQEAELMVKAVESIGGTSKLTQSELARFSSVTGEAAEKMRLLGVQGADAMNKLSESAKAHPTLLERITKALGPVGTAIAGAFTITAIVNAGKSVLDFADTVTNLSQRLGVSTNTIQRWQALFGQSGVSIESVAKAAGELANKVVGGDKSATAALEKLGISASSLRGMDVEQMFYVVADSVGALQNKGEQIYASKTLFGKSGVELLQGLNGHLKDSANELDNMGLIIDGKTIKAADDFGDQLGLMGKQLMGIVATIVGPLLPALSAIGNMLMWVGRNVVEPVFNVAIRGAMSVLEMFWAGLATLLARLADLAQKIPVVGAHLGALTTASDWLKKSAAETTARVDSLWRATDKSGESALKAAPQLIGLGEANEKGAKASNEHADALDKVAEKARKAQEAWLASIKPLVDYRTHIMGLAPVLDDFNDRTFDAADGVAGFTEQLHGLIPILPQASQETSSMFDGMSKSWDAFKQGLTGGNGIQGFFSNLGAGVVEGLGQIISGGMTTLIGMATDLAIKGLEKLADVVWSGMKKVGSFFGGLFSMPDPTPYFVTPPQTTSPLPDAFDPGAPPAYNPDPSYYWASGGAVYAAMGRVIPFIPRGTDTVPAMLTPGEGVVNLRGMRYLGEGGLSALNRGQAPAASGGKSEIHIHLEQDGRETAHVIVPYLPEVLREYGVA